MVPHPVVAKSGNPWTLRHHSSVSSAKVATIAEDALATMPTHVRVIAGSRARSFRVETRPGATGEQIFVAKDILPDKSTCEVLVIGRASYNWAQLKSGPRGRLVLAGLVLLIAGIVIQGVLAVGKIHPYVAASDATLTALTVVALVFQVTGGVLAFVINELLRSD
ncbi:hypothetical protein ACFQS1_38265 [Paractinoplanes rhizophilus]|uniref:Uncharacterized protein n=1 Tax=Paractinoplanes rhizophilus TaxID=1416877 RepID=A0ABW2I4M7_9ACTN